MYLLNLVKLENSHKVKLPLSKKMSVLCERVLLPGYNKKNVFCVVFTIYHSTDSAVYQMKGLFRPA